MTTPCINTAQVLSSSHVILVVAVGVLRTKVADEGEGGCGSLLCHASRVVCDQGTYLGVLKLSTVAQVRSGLLWHCDVLYDCGLCATELNSGFFVSAWLCTNSP